MEDDDEFGDLYTDVLLPFQPHLNQTPAAAAAVSSPSNNRPIDLNTKTDDDDEILYGASDSKNPNQNSWNLNSPIRDETLPNNNNNINNNDNPRGFDLNLDSNFDTDVSRVVDDVLLAGNVGLEEARVLEKEESFKVLDKSKSSFIDDDEDGINIVLDEAENNDKDVKDETFIDRNDNGIDLVNGSVIGEEQGGIIPGLSENLRGNNFEEDWDSDESEDDLRIVLNENNHAGIGMGMGMERMAGGEDDDDDEDGDPLVIVADNGDAQLHHQHMMMEDQQWGGEEGVGADGEKKEVGDAGKGVAGGGGVSVQPKVPYNNHVYHHSFHSQFKYVRPGAAPIPGAAPVPPGGMPGQFRPPAPVGPPAGRGRGDWRPPGIKGTVPIQKGFQTGYGVPPWGANGAGRGYGSGLDFTLPSHKTIFEVDIDSFEEKPWRLSGIDVSDFFNFGLSEESWKDYCKQLEQLRLETTMQSKIRVYESGRAEQDFDPDLPPELAAAAGIQEIPSDNANPGKANAGPTDIGRSSAQGRPPLHVGRPIPVETGSGERFPSIDTRRPRMHDNDAIIEILCHSSSDADDMTVQQDNDSTREDLRGGDETDELLQDHPEHIDHFSPAYNGQKKELVARRAQPKKTVSNGDDDILREDVSHSPPETPGEYQSDRVSGPDEKRSTKGRPKAGPVKRTARDNDREAHNMLDQNEELFNTEDANPNPPLSSPHTVGSDRDEVVVVRDDMNDESVTDDRSFDMEREEITVDDRGIPEDDNIRKSTKKEKRSSRAEQLSQESDNGEDSRGAKSSENSKGRSANSRDNQRFTDSVEDEVIQHRRHPRAIDIKKPVEDENNARRRGRDERDETERHHMLVKGREDSYSRRVGDLNSSLRRNVKNDGGDWRKESDISEGSRNQRDEDHYGRRTRVEEPRKRDHGRGKVRESERSEKDEFHQSRNQVDNGNWRVNHDPFMGSRPRDRDDIQKSRYEKVDDIRGKRRKEDTHSTREHSLKDEIPHNHIENSLRKRVRDDGSDIRKRDDQSRLKDDSLHYGRQKEEASFQRERSERWRESDEWHRLKQDEILSRREREDARPIMRNSRASEDKAWASHSRGKDDYKGSGRDYPPKDVGRHSDQLKRRDSVENGGFPQHRGHEDVYARGNQLGHDEKRPRHERPETRDDRVAYASDTSRLHEHKQKESSRKGKGSESGDHRSSSRSKRNQDEHGGHISETVNLRVKPEQQSSENRQSSKKHKEEGSSDDEQAADSRKGRSKLERWTSHKERDFTITPVSSASSLKTKNVDALNNRGASSLTKLPEESSQKIEEQPQPLADEKDTAIEMNNNNSTSAKVAEDKDKHLDTVEKLKKRSERFKLPLPTEKDAVTIKKLESEPLPLTYTETRPDSEIKSERPPRKRRWTGK